MDRPSRSYARRGKGADLPTDTPRPDHSAFKKEQWRLIGSLIRKYREQRGLSREQVVAELAKHIGHEYDAVSLGRWEDGLRQVPIELINPLAAILDVVPSDFFRQRP